MKACEDDRSACPVTSTSQRPFHLLWWSPFFAPAPISWKAAKVHHLQSLGLISDLEILNLHCFA